MSSCTYRPDKHGYVYFPLSYVRLVAVYKEKPSFAIPSVMFWLDECGILVFCVVLPPNREADNHKVIKLDWILTSETIYFYIGGIG